jgi:hypothetical protein
VASLFLKNVPTISLSSHVILILSYPCGSHLSEEKEEYIPAKIRPQWGSNSKPVGESCRFRPPEHLKFLAIIQTFALLFKKSGAHYVAC